MSEGNSTEAIKPSKPTLDFPLFLPATGRWAKKIRVKLVDFGRGDDPKTWLGS